MATLSQKILFATNRQQTGRSPQGLPLFGDTAMPVAPDALVCASATINGIQVAQPPSGTIGQIGALSSGWFSDVDLAPLMQSRNDVLVFLHGAANAFEDALTRAAYNQTWLAQATLHGASSMFDMIAFTWPSRPYQLWDVFGDYFDYRHDQSVATASAFHLALFFKKLADLKPQLGRRRLTLLCHSMGNYALAAGVEALYRGANPPGAALFDQIVLAAADEAADSFGLPPPEGLSDLHRLGTHITTYFNADDVAMHLSLIANGDYRIGYSGPPNMADLSLFPIPAYSFVDCEGVNDYISSELDAPDRSHQYYRQSPTVRADIAAILAGLQVRRSKFNPRKNCYSLF